MALEPITRQEKIIAGQDLTPITRMEKFLKSFGCGGGSGGVNPDWNQNDSTAPDYVKNRPFWREKTKELMFPDITEPIDVTTEDNGSGFFIADGRFAVALGATNYVVFDGVEYTCEPYYEEAIAGEGIGSFDFSDYPFFITRNIIVTKVAGDHTVQQYYGIEVVKYGYLPRLMVSSTWSTDTSSASFTVEDVGKIASAFSNGIPCCMNIRTSQAVACDAIVTTVGPLIIYAFGYGLSGLYGFKINRETGAVETTKYSATT